MKRFTAALLSALMIGSQTPAFSASDLHQLPTTITVNNLFGLTLDQTALAFGAHNPGTETTPLNVGIVARSNHGMSWVVVLQANPLTHTDGVTTIPGADFQYFHNADDPNSNEIPAVGNTAPVPTVEANVFEAGPNVGPSGNYNTQYTGFGLGFKVIIPADQKNGDYSTTVNIRMVDGF